MVTTYFTDFVNFKKGRTRPEPLNLRLHGCQGTGKSFLARCLNQAASDHGLGMACTAPAGIAASNLPRGQTVHNFCGFLIQPSTTKFFEKSNIIKLTSFHRAVSKSIPRITFDWRSAQFWSWDFWQLEKCMKEILDCDDHFGGSPSYWWAIFWASPFPSW